MTALATIPARDRLQAVMMRREGIGWIVGVGGIVAGTIERERSAHLGDREASAAAIELADRLDLLAVLA